MHNNKLYDLIIIGGGAAGLVAAGHAADLGMNVLLIEKMHRHGRKLRITGKGRCNLTNAAPLNEFIRHFGQNGKFLRQAFNNFFSDHLVDFFHNINVNTTLERGGRIFPTSGQAQEVVDSLVQWNKQVRVKSSKCSQVIELLKKEDKISGVIIQQNNSTKKIFANKIILCTGGLSYPLTGSTGDGYKLAKSVGHTIIPPNPALVPLEVNSKDIRMLDKLNLQNIKASIYVNGKKQYEEFGELLFTEFGVSGPTILTMSKNIVRDLKSNSKILLKIDLKPALDYKKLDNRLLRDISSKNLQNIDSLLRGLLPSQLIPFCLKETKISSQKTLSEITVEERKKIRMWLKNVTFEISNHRPIKEAIITSGGISLKEVNPRTMESNIVKNLYFAGEVLDIDADTGGYNLQAAFSTAWLASDSASKK